MVFQQPPKFLDLCERLKTAKPNTDGAKEFANTKSGGSGFAFERIVSSTLADLAKNYNVEPLQKKDASILFKPFTLDCSAQSGHSYTVSRDGQPLAEFDAIFKASGNEYWFFEVTSATKDEYGLFPNKQLLLLWGVAKQHKVACAYVVPHDIYDILCAGFFSKYKKIAKELMDLNAPLTYLDISRDDLHNLLGRRKT